MVCVSAGELSLGSPLGGSSLPDLVAPAHRISLRSETMFRRTRVLASIGASVRLPQADMCMRQRHRRPASITIPIVSSDAHFDTRTQDVPFVKG